MANDLELQGGIKPVNAVPVDGYYGPYANAADACTAVPLAVRAKGIHKVGILQSDGSVADYWWKSGTADSDLIPYTPDMTPYAKLNGGNSFEGDQSIDGNIEVKGVANRTLTVRGGSAGDGSGAQVNFYNGSNPIGSIGNVSAVTGGPYDDAFYMRSTNGKPMVIGSPINFTNDIQLIGSAPGYTSGGFYIIVKNAVTGRLEAVSINSANGILQLDSQGKIASTILHLDSTPTSGSTNPITSNGVKTAIDTAVTGLYDDRGNYDPTATAAYPTSSNNGSGPGGAILKGDIWTISADGNITGFGAVKMGYTVRALVDSPGQTASNWDIIQVGLGYIPENAANKDQNGGYIGRTSNGKLNATTDMLDEGSTNKYYTDTRAQAALAANLAAKADKKFSLAFINPATVLPDYFEDAVAITSIQLITGAASFKYSTNGGTSWVTPTLPLTVNINFSAGTTVLWQISYISGSVRALIYIKYQ